MKQIIIIFLVLSSFFVNAQNINLEELTTLRGNNIENIKQFLTNKNWKIVENTDSNEANNTLASIKFEYNNNNTYSIILYQYSKKELYDNIIKRISIIILNEDTFNNYQNYIKKIGCKLIKSNVEGNSIEEIYQGEHNYYSVNTYIETNENNESIKYCIIYVFSLLDYNLNIE